MANSVSFKQEQVLNVMLHLDRKNVNKDAQKAIKYLLSIYKVIYILFISYGLLCFLQTRMSPKYEDTS